MAIQIRRSEEGLVPARFTVVAVGGIIAQLRGYSHLIAVSTQVKAISPVGSLTTTLWTMSLGAVRILIQQRSLPRRLGRSGRRHQNPINRGVRRSIGHFGHLGNGVESVPARHDGRGDGCRVEYGGIWDSAVYSETSVKSR
jgi:hypothetical protein